MWLRRRRLTPICLSGRWHSSVAAQPADSPPPHISDVPKELCFFNDFAHSVVDLHVLLLTEANRKHGVHLNVPPQLPPPGSPPEVPDVIFTEAQTERLKGLKLAYEPTYGPPPLSTTGTRGLADVADISPTQGSGAASPVAAAPNGTSVTQRRPIEADKKFHCSLCGKPFRIELSAVHHVQEIHKGESSAKVLQGPGPGELEVVVVAEVAPPTAAPLDPTEAKPAPLTESQYKKLSCVALPSEDDVDDLLRRIWDDIGRKRGGEKFTALSDAVVGIADDRKPFSELDLKPLVRATPENAAPGVKRVATSSPSANAATRTGTVISGKPLKELSARFPNPFGDSVESKLLQQMKDEPMNPFLPITTRPPSEHSARDAAPAVAGQPSLQRAAKGRPYQCHVCAQSFRLMDGLLDHLQSAHELELTSDELRHLLARRVSSNPFVEPKKGSGEGTPTVGGTSDSDGVEGIISTNDLAALPPAPIIEADVGVHIRAGSNTVLVGEVVDIQKGFVKSLSVTQFVVKTREPSSVGADESVTEEWNEEFVVVRVLGDSMKYVVDHIKVSQSIMVHGCLKMNRRLDDASKRSHAYPFVQVLSPLGSIAVVE